jgi:hypothetical protein
MTMLIPVRRRRTFGRGITTLADVPADRPSKVLHLCRFPERCCSVCGRHKGGCWHERIRRHG